MSQKFALLGSGGATPYSARGNASAVAMDEQGAVLFDCGSGSMRALDELGIQLRDVDTICITHFHADHCLELPLLLLGVFIDGREEPIAIFGPEGIDDFLAKIFSGLFPYIPTLVRNITGSDPKYTVGEVDRGLVQERLGAQIMCAPANHGIPAVGYRYDGRDFSAVVSGDTAYSDSIIELAAGANILVHECPFPPSMGSTPGHTTPSEVGRVASSAGVDRVVLTHLFAETLGHEEEMVVDVRKAFDGVVVVGQDAMLLHDSTAAK